LDVAHPLEFQINVIPRSVAFQEKATNHYDLIAYCPVMLRLRLTVCVGNDRGGGAPIQGGMLTACRDAPNLTVIFGDNEEEQ
jgi:hypothetical protein